MTTQQPVGPLSRHGAPAEDDGHQEDHPMGIKLDISLETPLSDDDRDILAGISVMVLAIANRQDLVGQAQQEQDYEDVTEGMEPLYCGTLAPDASGSCVCEPGHSGRHQFRPLLDPGARMNQAPSGGGTPSPSLSRAPESPGSTTARQPAP